jgi:hypothetical protein
MSMLEVVQETQTETVLDPAVVDFLKREEVPAALWGLAEGAKVDELEVVHLNTDPLLYVKGELVAFWA